MYVRFVWRSAKVTLLFLSCILMHPLSEGVRQLRRMGVQLCDHVFRLADQCIEPGGVRHCFQRRVLVQLHKAERNEGKAGAAADEWPQDEPSKGPEGLPPKVACAGPRNLPTSDLVHVHPFAPIFVAWPGYKETLRYWPRSLRAVNRQRPVFASPAMQKISVLNQCGLQCLQPLNTSACAHLSGMTRSCWVPHVPQLIVATLPRPYKAFAGSNSII